MAGADTLAKRRSVGVLVLDIGNPLPDTLVAPGDRRHEAWIYRAPVTFDDVAGLIEGIAGLDSPVEQVYDEAGVLAGIVDIDSPVVQVYDEAGTIEGILDVDSPVAQVYTETGLLAGILDLDASVEFVNGLWRFFRPGRAQVSLAPTKGTAVFSTSLTGSVSLSPGSTANKRRSVQGYSFMVIAPVPDTAIGAPDRRHVDRLYPGPLVFGNRPPTAHAALAGTPSPGKARMANLLTEV